MARAIPIAETTTPAPLPATSTRAWTYAALVLATFAAYFGVWRGDWIQFDDTVYVTKNTHVVHGLSWDAFLWFLKPTTTHGGNWHPLTSWSHLLDVTLFGPSPAGPHVVNLALHVANACLLLYVLASWTRAWWPSAFVAAFFALHPLRVESVAWISERKDVLSTLFFLLAIDAYRRYLSDRRRARYALLVAWFVLGLMSKPMLVTLPFVLLLLDVWPARRITFESLARFDASARPLWKEKLPLFALAAASAAMTFYAQHASGATQSLTSVPLLPRLSNAVLGYQRYLVKTFWPKSVAVYYPYDRGVPPLLPVVTLLILAGLTAWLIRARARSPYLLVGWLWYLGTLVPVIGIVQVGGQAYADRYTYVPVIGIGIVLAFGASAFVSRSRTLSMSVAIAACIGLAMLLVRTREIVPLWRSTRTLFGHAVAVTHDNALAEQVYGNALLSEGEVDAGIVHLREALRIAPDFPDAHNNLGAALGVKGRYEEALEHLRAGQRTQPTVEVYHNMGFVLSELKRFDEAIEAFRAALAIEPDHIGAHAKLGLALGAQGRLVEAAAELRRTLELAPNEIESRRYYAVTLKLLGKRAEAVVQYEELLARKPNDEAALRDLVATQRELAIKKTFDDKIEDAIGWYRKILERSPDDLDALNNIAWIRAAHSDAAHRNAEEAVRLAERARDKSAQPVAVLYSTLAAAYGEAGRFDDAVKACERAIELARAAQQPDEAERYATQLESYRARRPFHMP